MPLSATNPYGRTKLMSEQILNDLTVSDKGWKITVLRYFNPAGAHESGLIGEDPLGPPDNLVPYISQVAAGVRERLIVLGNDYDTPDGTGIRDYLHVQDLAEAHLCAIERLVRNDGLAIYNLGTGKGYSVLEVLASFEKASGKKILYEIGARRTGDIAICYADPSKAQHHLGWKAVKSLDEMCTDAWRWQSLNPHGYHKG
jgi:UDP-glucose 4-epimerase